uniref:Uncharacterized protein LOC114348144 n=1 Tax=Diabrotica virgifera virgifera TaxID=50390 RepID=A0A6P7GXV2_DIAVI
MSGNGGGPGPPSVNLNNNNQMNNNDSQINVSSMDTVSSNFEKYDFDNKYQPADAGPYQVFLEHTDKNLGRLFPIRIGFYLQQVIEFRNDVIDIHSVGLKRVKVIFRTYKIANLLINHEILIKN